MNKRFTVIFSVLTFLIFSINAQNAEEVVEKLITELTLDFEQTHPDLALKPNLAVFPVQDQSPSAREYEVGPAFTAIIESMVQRSLLFNLIDEKLRDKMIEEMKFSLTGLAESEKLEPGEIMLAEYFLVGSVTELGKNFRLTLQLVSVETGEIILSRAGSLPKEEVFEVSEAFTAAYVSPYGLGIEFGVLPWASTYGKTADIEGQPHSSEYNMFSLKLYYRIRKWLVTWGGLELAPGALRFEDSYNENKSGYSGSEVVNFTEDLPDESEITYSKDRSPYYSIHLGAGYVWNFTRKLNLTLGTDLSMAQTFLVQKYVMPTKQDPDINTTNIITSNDITLWTLAPLVKLQYFLTPRLALNAEYKFRYRAAILYAAVSLYLSGWGIW